MPVDGHSGLAYIDGATNLRWHLSTLASAALAATAFAAFARAPWDETLILGLVVMALALPAFSFARLDRSERVWGWLDIRNVIETVVGVTGVVACMASWTVLVPHVSLGALATGLAVALGALIFPRLLWRQIRAAPAEIQGLANAVRGRPTAWILSLTPVTGAPRVRRQAEALLRSGWNVVAVGYPGPSKMPPGWMPLFVNGYQRRITRIERVLVALALPFSRWSEGLAEQLYWLMSGHHDIDRTLAATLARHPELACTLAIANEYITAPLAARLAGPRSFCIDVHEASTSEYNHRWLFRVFLRPWIDALQRRFLRRAAFVSTIGQGIAGMLQRDYSIEPVVVRSVPEYVEMPFRPCGREIAVLYHGLLDPQRGLEAAIASVRRWRPEFRLTIRGPGNPAFVESLRLRAREQGVSHRVDIVPPVAFDEIVREANRADIGYFVQPAFSAQKRLTLPNKLFEYIMAGLALCVSDLPEMAAVVRQWDLGRLVPDADPAAIAEVINSFTREAIEHSKRRALAAAKELHWRTESEAFIRACVGAVPPLSE